MASNGNGKVFREDIQAGECQGAEYRGPSQPDHFTMIPDLVCDMGLDAGAFRLYVHYCRITRRGWKTCYQTNATVAAACNMSGRSVIRHREKLEQSGLISIKRIAPTRTHAVERVIITVTNIWEQNRIKYSKEQPPSGRDDKLSGVGVTNCQGEGCQIVTQEETKKRIEETQTVAALAATACESIPGISAGQTEDTSSGNGKGISPSKEKKSTPDRFFIRAAEQIQLAVQNYYKNPARRINLRTVAERLSKVHTKLGVPRDHLKTVLVWYAEAAKHRPEFFPLMFGASSVLEKWEKVDAAFCRANEEKSTIDSKWWSIPCSKLNYYQREEMRNRVEGVRQVILNKWKEEVDDVRPSGGRFCHTKELEGMAQALGYPGYAFKLWPCCLEHEEL